jgi:predicted PurR-regulated permease PerM
MVNFPTDFQRRTLWSAGTGLAIVLLGSILVGLIWLAGQVLSYLQPVLVPLAVAGIIAYLLDPVVQWFQRHRHLSRFQAVLTVFGGTLLIITLFLWFLIPRVVEQSSRLLGDEENLGESIVRTMEKLQESIPGVDPLITWLSAPVDELTGETISRPDVYIDHTAEDADHRMINETEELPDNEEEVGQVITRKLEKLQGSLLGLDPLLIWLSAPAGGTTDETTSRADAFIVQFHKDANQQFIFKNSEGEILEPTEITEDDRKAARNYYYRVKNTPFSHRKIGRLLMENSQTLTRTGFDWLRASSKVFGFIGYLLGFILVPVYLFYFLNESSKIKSSWHQYVPLKASKFKDEVVDTLSEINSYLISFFRGQVLVSLIDGILVGIALSIFQLPYGFLIGVALAILGILPFIGNILCMIPATLIAFIHFGSANANHQWLGDSPWAYAGAVIAIFLVVQQINSLATAPKIVGDSVGLHPMTVIFSIIFWSLLLGGFIGALLAVPLTAAVKVLFARYVWQRRVSPHLAENTEDVAFPISPS